MIATSDGGYAIAGSKGGNNSWLVKTDALGNMQWNKTYETGQGGATALVLSPDGGYTITGWHSGSEYDYWLVKTDALGNIQWYKTYGGAQFYPELIIAPDGGYVMAGIRFLVKTDPLGNMEWNQTYGEAGIYSVDSVVAMSDGGYTLAGSMRIIEPFCRKAWLVKTDEFGVYPEYSFWLVPVLVLTATAFIIINSKKLLHKRSSLSR